MLSCAAICQTSATFMLRSSAFSNQVCRVCAEVREACAKGCKQLSGTWKNAPEFAGNVPRVAARWRVMALRISASVLTFPRMICRSTSCRSIIYLLLKLMTNKSYSDITAEINHGILKLRQSVPDTMAGFNAMAKGALKPGVLSEVHKELIALAIGVAGHCDGCIGFHAKSLARLDAKRDEVMEALAVAVYMGGGPSLMYAAEAIHAFDEFTKSSPVQTPPDK